MDAKDNIDRILQISPNPYMTAYAFYYKIAAQYLVYNNAFILPVWDGSTLTALYPINAARVELVEKMGIMFARLVFSTVPSSMSRSFTSAAISSTMIFSGMITAPSCLRWRRPRRSTSP